MKFNEIKEITERIEGNLKSIQRFSYDYESWMQLIFREKNNMSYAHVAINIGNISFPLIRCISHIMEIVEYLEKGAGILQQEYEKGNTGPGKMSFESELSFLMEWKESTTQLLSKNNKQQNQGCCNEEIYKTYRRSVYAIKGSYDLHRMAPYICSPDSDTFDRLSYSLFLVKAIFALQKDLQFIPGFIETLNDHRFKHDSIKENEIKMKDKLENINKDKELYLKIAKAMESVKEDITIPELFIKGIT